MDKIRPLKRFGQNYIKDDNILRKIVTAIAPAKGDRIIEIGPGTGALTEKLLEHDISLTAIEIDKRVKDELKLQFPELDLITADFLQTDLTKLTRADGKKLRITGNIPYNLTSPIIFKLLNHMEIISDAVLMVQFEVAKRMKSGPGTKEYGILSVILSRFAKVEICFKVPPTVFYPKPKVHSAVIKISFTGDSVFDEYAANFISIVKASFGNRRKTLKNSLSNSIFGDIDFSTSGIDMNKRAEQIDVAGYDRLARFISDRLGKN